MFRPRRNHCLPWRWNHARYEGGRKKYVGKDIRHIAIFRKTEPEQVYNMVYQDGRGGNAMVKRFTVGGTTRDKEYVLTKGNEGSKVLYFSVSTNPAEIINVKLRPKPKLRKTEFEFDLNTIEVKGRNSIGNILSRNLVNKITKGGVGKANAIAEQMTIDGDSPRSTVDSRQTKEKKKVEVAAKSEKAKTSKLKPGRPEKKIALKTVAGKKKAAAKDEAPVTLEWDLSGKQKVQNDRSRILSEIEKKAEQKKKAQLKMDM